MREMTLTDNLFTKAAEGQEVRCWTVRGYTGRKFSLGGVTQQAIEVVAMTTGIRRSISRAEIDKLAAQWDAYKSGKVTRQTLGKISFNTSYIFGLLHLAEDSQTTG
jgi:hypothetical protein